MRACAWQRSDPAHSFPAPLAFKHVRQRQQDASRCQVRAPRALRLSPAASGRSVCGGGGGLRGRGPAGAPRLRQVLRRPVGELVPVAQLGDAGPLVLAGRAQQLEDVQQLLQLAVAGEERDLRRRRPPVGRHAPPAPLLPREAHCVPVSLHRALTCSPQTLLETSVMVKTQAGLHHKT